MFANDNDENDENAWVWFCFPICAHCICAHCIWIPALGCRANLRAFLRAARVTRLRGYIFQCVKPGVFLRASSDGHLQILLQPIVDLHWHQHGGCMQTRVRNVHKTIVLVNYFGQLFWSI